MHLIRKILYFLAASVSVIVVYLCSTQDGIVPNLTFKGLVRKVHRAFQSTSLNQPAPNPLYNIFWLHPKYEIEHQLSREEKLFRGFKSCEYKNCNITYSYNANEAVKGDVVIFPGREVGPKLAFKRPHGQVWVFVEIESPAYMYLMGDHWKRDPWRSQFNWTMTYDAPKSDISLKYGEIRPKETKPNRNYTAIALNKTDDVLIVNSHCSTHSKREKYITELSKNMSVKTLGACGVKWNCGRICVPDDCFKILNQYRFYLAFENSLCDMYFTEKVFHNFNYDTVIITRGGGRKGDVKNVLPDGTYISTDDFDSVKSLAEHLKNLSSSVTEYANIVKLKDQYYNVDFVEMYKQAMCDICKRMNRQDEYRQTIPDMGKLWFSNEPCRKSDDVN